MNKKGDEMMTTYFTSDTHFGHGNIIFLTGRPFRSTYEMDKTMIENWNSRVDKNDFVIFLGDFAYRNAKSIKNYMDRLHGHITFVNGNHDAQLGANVIQSLVFNSEEFGEIFCVHDPKDFSSSYRINLVGHVHCNWKVKKFYDTTIINVGVDVWDFAPVTLQEIMKMKDRFEIEWRKKWKRRYGKK